jgi:dethiobiotin synthetase
MNLFIAGTGTGVGKTWLTRGLARALTNAGARVAAIKPIETGCVDGAADARALAAACNRPELDHQGLYRASAPLAPYAAELEGERRVDLSQLVAHTRALASDADAVLVEGAGGLFTPLDAEHDVADLARALELPLLLVAKDELGTLSATIAHTIGAAQRGLMIAACVLTQPSDASSRTNGRILAERLPCPVLALAPSRDDDDALAEAAAPIIRRLRAP